MESRYRRYTGRMNLVAKGCAIALPVIAIIYILDIVRRYFGVFVYPVTYASLFLGIALTAVFLTFPATKSAPKDRLPWYDLLLIVASLTGSLYICVNFAEMFDRGISSATPFQITLGFITLGVLCEAVRRTIGWPMIAVVLLFFLHAWFSYLLPGLLGGPRYSMSQITLYMYLQDAGIFGTVLQIAAVVIVAFMIFGSLLQEFGGGKFFINLALSIAGRARGGPAKVAILTSALFGMISGSPSSNVGTTGVLTIPMMKSRGYEPHYAAGVEAVAATGGILMPPVMGATAFLMADFTKAGYGAICLAAILPAVLYFLCVYFQVDFRSAIKGHAGLRREEIPSLRQTMKDGWHYLIPIVILVILLMVMQYSPTKSILYASAVLLAVAAFKRETRPGLGKILNCLGDAGRAMLQITPICAILGIITGSVTLTGLGINLSVMLVDIAGGNLLLLAILAWVVIYLMGTGVSIIATYILMAILVAPALVQLGVPVLAAHMFIFYMGMSMFFTPPNAPAVFMASVIAGARIFPTALQAMRLGIVCYLVPFVILFSPALVLIGSADHIVVAFITSMIGALFIAAGVEGYLLRKASWWQRILFVAGGLCLFVPGYLTDVIGVFILLIAVYSQWKGRQASLMMAKDS